jgi:hypothetical protein
MFVAIPAQQPDGDRHGRRRRKRQPLAVDLPSVALIADIGGAYLLRSRAGTQ